MLRIVVVTPIFLALFLALPTLALPFSLTVAQSEVAGAVTLPLLAAWLWRRAANR